MQKRVTLKIYGRVQGVFFRHESSKRASVFRLSGYARNEPDGTVIIVAEGAEPQLKEFIEWCREGPRLAAVERVETLWQAATGEFDDFTIRR